MYVCLNLDKHLFYLLFSLFEVLVIGIYEQRLDACPKIKAFFYTNPKSKGHKIGQPRNPIRDINPCGRRIFDKYKKSNPTKDENVIEIDEGDGDNTEDDVEPNEGQEDLDFKECKDNVLSFLY